MDRRRYFRRAILLICCTEYTESVLDILSYLESVLGSPWLGLCKNVETEILRRLENAIR